MQIELKFINFLRREYRVSIRDIEQALKEEGKEASRGFVSEVLTGKRTAEQNTQSKGGAKTEDILATVRKLLTSNYREKERTSKSPHLHITKHN
ncbi:MAG: hypothetical protein N3A69_04160 [Leptospiraceae bacterium]|nr:hypothetical protein [Leptospiraceae bacterium]